MAALLDRLRAAPPTEVEGLTVRSCVDHADPAGVHGPIRSATDAASRDVLALGFDDGRLIFRPSGTEPKLKVYVEATGASHEEAAAVLGKLEAAVSTLLG